MKPETRFNSERLRGAYDALALQYEANRGLFEMSELIAEFLERLPTTGALLDLGCGSGDPVAQTFIDRGWHVTGVDFCPRMLALAANRVPEMTTVASDMREVSFPPARFDAITAVYSLFHVPWIEHPRLFKRMGHWLRPEGFALFTYATAAYTGADEFNGEIEFMGQRLFYSHTSIARLHDQLAAAGLHVVESRERAIGGERFLWVTVVRAR
jgi:SAM-dependent methyltransferase